MINVAMKINEYPNKVDASYLSSLQVEISDLRTRLFRFAESITAPLGNILIEHYKERLARAENLPMLGEYAPFMIGDLFGARLSVVEALAFPWLLLYEYGLLIDDLLDKSQLHWAQKLLLSQVLLDVSQREYRKSLGDDEILWAAYNAYMQEWINGMLHEIEWPSEPEKNTEIEAIIQQGRKAAIVKFCAASILHLDGGRLLSTTEERGFEHLIAGIQLLDDLTDVLEDHRAGRLNVLLSGTYKWLQHNSIENMRGINIGDMDENQLLVGLFYSGAIERSWELAAGQIDKAMMLLSHKENGAAIYFKAISTKCRDSCVFLSSAARNRPDIRNILMPPGGEGRQILKNQGKSVKIAELLTVIAERMNNGPKASN